MLVLTSDAASDSAVAAFAASQRQKGAIVELRAPVAAESRHDGLAVEGEPLPDELEPIALFERYRRSIFGDILAHAEGLDRRGGVGEISVRRGF